MAFQLESVMFCSSPKSVKKPKLQSKKFKPCASRNTKRRFLFLVKVTVAMEGEGSRKKACLFRKNPYPMMPSQIRICVCN